MLDALIEIARAAGREILEVYDGHIDVDTKADDTPLTQADLRAHQTIVAGLQALTPDWPIVSEESVPPPFDVRRHWRRYWLVDPLDGTKEFVGRNGEFTVNIALIEDGTPVLGVVGAPTHATIYVGDCRTGLAFRLERGSRTALRTRRLDSNAITVVTSRRHGSDRLAGYLEELAQRFGAVNRQAVGSSLKFCLLAQGEADCYPRLGPTSEWDTAAAHAVLDATGGTVLRGDGSALVYNAKESLLNPSFIAVGDPDFPWQTHLPCP